MLEYIVEGGRELYGSVTVSGSKNAALPVLFASLAVDGISEISNLPDIGDVRVALEILEKLGVSVQRSGNTVRLYTERAAYSDGITEPSAKLRASTYLLGGCLARLGRVPLMPFGGCNFSDRPIDIHIDAALAFGAKRAGDILYTDGLTPSDFTLRKSSVGASVNSLILAASAGGESILRGLAKEPHVDLLIKYLVSAGASIEREGEITRVRGGKLRDGRVRIPPDMIEAGSFLIASALVGGTVKIFGAPVEELESLISVLREGGVCIKIGDGYISASGRPREKLFVTTGPYPDFPTDLQPLIAPLMAKGCGGYIRDTVWPERFGYLDTLGAQGLCFARSGNEAEIYPSSFIPASVSAPDLRGGAASLIAALVSKGITRISGAEIIDRGYDSLADKLSGLGARVRVEKSNFFDRNT